MRRLATRWAGNGQVLDAHGPVVRLFVGVPVPCGDALRSVRDTLRGLDGVRPVPEGTEHVTLRFLGDVPEDEADPVQEAVDEAVAGCHAMNATVPHLGAFKDPKHARIVWAAVEAEGLDGLQQRVAEETADLGQAEGDRQFVPHVTLARCKHPRDVRRLLREHPGPFWEGRLDEVVLFSSRLTPEGPHYERVRTWTLD